jgi:hypothetical protein
MALHRWFAENWRLARLGMSSVPVSLPAPQQKPHPSILIVTIPKSGTIYTSQLLAGGLDLTAAALSAGCFPRYTIDIEKIATFAGGGQLAMTHCDGCAENLHILSGFLDRWVVHIRDPRSVLLSWVHHLDRLYDERNNGTHQLLYTYPTPPAGYFELPFLERIEWNIANFLPQAIRWVKDWLDVYDSGRHNILLTTFTELARTERAYVEKVLDFYAIPRSAFVDCPIDKTACHFRVGREDEWAQVLTRDQIARTTRMIGRPLLDRFDWPDPADDFLGRGPAQSYRDNGAGVAKRELFSLPAC